MHNFSDYGFVNIGTGEDLAIIDLARTIKDIVGYEGEIVHDLTKPDGTPRKLMSVDKLHAMGWKHRIGLREGIESVYAELSSTDWF
jgi:GDP-L-fucose synthase